jgi:hypothetical protein
MKATITNTQERAMKFMCLGYYDESSWADKSEAEIQAMMDACFTYDLQLRESGHCVGGDALASIKNSATVQMKNGKPVVTDGPFTETKEQIGGVLYLQARDLQQAIELMSKHPGIKNGPFEIRQIDEGFQQVFEQWLAAKKKS